MSPFLIPITFMVMAGVVAIGAPLARAYARRIEGGPPRGSVPPDLSARIERMEHALDTIAVEIERISEGQRFTTKLLSERVGGREGEPAGGQRIAGVPAGGNHA
jgi:hypothetical protein